MLDSSHRTEPFPRALKRTLKSWLLPRGPKVRRLPLGLGRGLRMTVDFQAGQVGMYLGLYEVELNRHIMSLCRPGYRTFDVGGALGYDALLFAKLSSAPVVTIECLSDNCREIEKNIGFNPDLSPLIEVRDAFISAQSAESGGHLSLDDLSKSTFVPDFIKLDIEGGESDALRGANSILKTRRPNLLIEVHGQDEEDRCLDILRAHGYAPPVFVNPRKWLPDYRPLGHNRWLVAHGSP